MQGIWFKKTYLQAQEKKAENIKNGNLAWVEIMTNGNYNLWYGM